MRRVHHYLFPVILFQALAFGHELAEGFLFFPFQRRESVQDVGEVIPRKAIETGDISVDLGAELGAVASVPPVGHTIVNSTVQFPFGCKVLCCHLP